MPRECDCLNSDVPNFSAQLEMHRQDGLAGHGYASGHGRAEAGAHHGLAGGLVQAVARSLEDIDGRDLAGRIEGDPQHHGPFLAQPPGLARVLGHDHARDRGPARGPETEQPALAPSLAAPLTAWAPACAGPASFGRHAVASRTGCADAAARGVASPCARDGSGRHGCRFSRRFLSAMSRERFMIRARGFRRLEANGFRLGGRCFLGGKRGGCDGLWLGGG